MDAVGGLAAASHRTRAGRRIDMGDARLGSLAAGQGLEARGDLEKAVALDPDLPEMHNNLASVLWGTGDQAGAEKEFREALRIQPGIAEWRLNLGRVLASRGELPEARFQFEQAVKLKSEMSEARLEYGHLLEDRGDSAGAIRELSAAVRLQSDLWRAQFELGMALGRKGDTTGALEHLRIAASGSDAEVRAAALQVLQEWGDSSGPEQASASTELLHRERSCRLRRSEPTGSS